jgi:hypothetical protein
VGTSGCASGWKSKWLEEQDIPYVMAIAYSEMITTAAGRFRAGELAALVPASGCGSAAPTDPRRRGCMTGH